MSAIKSLFNVAFTVAALSSMGVGLHHMYKTGEYSDSTRQKLHSSTMDQDMKSGTLANELTADINKMRNTLHHLQTGFKQTVIDPSVQVAADLLGANANSIIVSQKQMEHVTKKGLQLVNDSKEKISTLVHGMDM